MTVLSVCLRQWGLSFVWRRTHTACHYDASVLPYKQKQENAAWIDITVFLARKSSRISLKCNGTRAETRFRLSAKQTSPFKSAWASVQSTAGSRGVGISGSNAGYNMFRGSVKSTGYPLHSPVSSSLPLPSVTVWHQGFSWTLPILGGCFYFIKFSISAQGFQIMTLWTSLQKRAGRVRL